MKAKLGNFSPSTLIGTGLVFSSVALVSGGVLSYSARTHQFYASPAQGLPRTTERPTCECGDEPRTSGVEQGERLVRGECSELPRRAVPQSHGRKSVVRGLPESENGGRLWQATGADGVVIPFSTLTREMPISGQVVTGIAQRRPIT